ncbi:DEAD/DEAH box helicase [Vibrio sp. FNV 38]|nr:DEAD/DEAH box helicase [Vibrio sp. FNV 38]
MPFSSLKLSPELITVLRRNFSEPTEIQSLSIPSIIENHDVFALAQTGSGKTLAFGLPIIDKALNDKHLTTALIIVPTRELASQVHIAIESLSSLLGITSISLTGGVDKAEQIHRLEQRPNIIIATPGRLLELISDNVVMTDRIKTIVLDEADRMLDMGFWPDINTLINKMPKQCQTLLFSATFSDDLEQKAYTVLNQPKQIKATAKVDNIDARIDEILYLVNKGSKTNALIDQIKQQNWQQVLVFVGVKDNADAICKKINKAGITSAALHGDKDQTTRETTLNQFKQGLVQVLVSTDLLARGIHIDCLPNIVNYDLPSNPKTYVHRIGRTARAGESGTAVSLVCHGEAEELAAIRVDTGRDLPLIELADFPVTDQPSTGNSKRAPRDKQANRRTNKKNSIKQFRSKGAPNKK